MRRQISSKRMFANDLRVANSCISTGFHGYILSQIHEIVATVFDLVRWERKDALLTLNIDAGL